MTSPIQSRPGSVMQEENNDGAGAAGGSDYSGVAQRTVANIRRLQDNMCSQYVQSRQVSTSSSHVSQYELENCCLQSDGDTPQQPPDNQELVTLSPLRVNLPSPPPSPKPVSDDQEQQSPHLSTQDPNWQSNKAEFHLDYDINYVQKTSCFQQVLFHEITLGHSVTV